MRPWRPISGDQNLVRTAGDVIKKYFDSTSKEADVVEAVLLPAPTAKDYNDGYVAAEEMETGTEAALPTLASSEASWEVADGGRGHVRPCPGHEPRKKRGKGC